jgi:hypothetical protein
MQLPRTLGNARLTAILDDPLQAIHSRAKLAPATMPKIQGNRRGGFQTPTQAFKKYGGRHYSTV